MFPMGLLRSKNKGTPIFIAITKQQPGSVLERLRGKGMDQVGISSIALSAKCFGVERSARPEQNLAALHEFILPLEVAPYDDASAMRYGAVRAALAKQGQAIGSLDTPIAAHALSLDGVLVTHNLREFSRVAGLRLEDWLKQHGIRSIPT